MEAAGTLAGYESVPYRPTSGPAGFAVHRPKFLSLKGPQPDWQIIGEALWQGITQHEKGAEIWNQYFDESI